MFVNAGPGEPITPSRARSLLDEQLAAVGYHMHDGASSRKSGNECDLFFDESTIAAWPYYAAMLEVAETPAEISWVGWQLISYLFLDAERWWPDRGASLVPVVAAVAVKSARLGAFLSEWLVFHSSEASPAAAVLAVDILNSRYGWDIENHVRQIRDNLPGGSGSVSYVVPRSDFSAVSVRSAICWSFAPESAPIPVPVSEPRQRWSEANSRLFARTESKPSEKDVARALRKLRHAQNQPGAGAWAERTVVCLLEHGTAEFAHDSTGIGLLCEAIEAIEPLRDSVVWLAMRSLLTSLPLPLDRGSRPYRDSAWRALRAGTRA